MSRRYPPEVHEFIAANVVGTTTRTLAELVNQKFNLDFTEAMMKSYKANHKLKSGTRCGNAPGWSKVYPPEVRAFIAEHVEGRSTEELVRMLNKEFDTDYGVTQMRAYKKNHGLSSGIDCRFRKGSVPPNKGKKGIHIPGCEKGWFQKGHRPANYLPVGSEVVNTEGYVVVKIADPNIWEFKHKIIWRLHHGGIPEGKILTFLDGDKLNTDVSNLALITNEENLQMNRSRLRSDEPEYTQSGILVARLAVTAHKRRKQLRERRSGDGN